jgi:DoxX-like family
MVSEIQPASKKIVWAGYIATALPVMMLLFSASGKFLKPEGMEPNIVHLGWRMDQMTSLGILELACVIIYLIPRTAVFGAVLLTAYLGGATATHVRIGDPYFFPIVTGIFVWLGIYLREPRLWDLSPFRK